MHNLSQKYKKSSALQNNCVNKWKNRGGNVENEL